MQNSTLGPVLIGIAGQQLSTQDREILQHPAVGGVVVFSRNFKDPAQLTALVADIRGIRTPRLLVAVDQEGGRVQRLQSGFTRLPALAGLGQQFENDPDGALDLAFHHGWLMSSEVLALGIDISFAPVLDLDCGSHVIGDRSFHEKPGVVTALARAYVEGMHAAGMCATGKHFPGHGSVVADSHTADVLDSRDLEQIRVLDLHPFTELSGSLDAVMMAHVCYADVDELPAGFSKSWLQDILRGELGYGGTVFSDDLDMQAAVSKGIMHERVWCALDAGCDAVLICDPDSARAYLGALGETLPHTGDRLSRMYGKTSVGYEALRATTRWQKWHAVLEQLNS